MVDDLELRLKQFFANALPSADDTRALSQMGSLRAPLSAVSSDRRQLSRHLFLRSVLALAVLVLAFTLGITFDESRQKPQVLTTTSLANQLTQQAMVQSAPTSWSLASNSAQAVGDTLVRPTWLPFNAPEPAVQQAFDSHGLLFTTSQYKASTGGAWVLVSQAHIKVIGSVTYNHPTGTTQVGTATATIFQYSVTTGAGAFDEVGVGWVGSNGKLITVTGRGLSVDDVVKVARSVA